MKQFAGKLLMVVMLGILCSACSVTRKLSEGEYFLQRVKIEADKETPRDERITAYTLEQYVRQTPNKRFLGTNFYVWAHNLANPRKTNWWNNFKRKIGQEPVLLDMSLTERSARNLQTYMDSRGYYSSSVSYEIDTTRRPKRAYVTYRTHQGEPYRIKSISYEFRNRQLGPIIEADTAQSLLKVGNVFDIPTLDKERERIAKFLNNRGFYDFSINNIEYRVDTLGGNREANVRMIVKRNITGYDDRGRAITDNSHIFRIKDINVLTDYDPAVAESTYRKLLTDTTYFNGINIISQGKPNVRPSVMHAAVPLTANSIYDASRIERTYTEIMSLGYFKSARITFEELPDSLSTFVNYAGEGRKPYSPDKFEDIKEKYLSCNILCSPTLKQGYNIELEGSTTSSFYGLSATIGYQNRNLFRGLETLNASLTFGYEYMKGKHAARRSANEVGVAVGMQFPRFVAPFHIPTRNINMPRTKLELSYNYQDRPYYRRDLSRITWAYSWRSLNGRYHYQLRPIDVNWINVGYIDNKFFSSLENEYLRQSYLTQAIVGLSASYTYNNQNKHIGGNATLLRANFESAGNLLNLAESIFSSKTAAGDYEILGVKYSQYVRGDVSLSRKIVLGERTALAGRIFAGVGVPYGNSSSLPFDRLFYVGGSNSMRGWTPRTLGPGNTPAQNTPFPVQMGDMRLEANLELRFPIWDMFNGATFFDLGNVWYLGNGRVDIPADGIFSWKDFHKQLGFNTGLGLRIDITFVILRLDWGVQLHNPNLPAGHRWIEKLRWKNTALNFGVGYPF